MLRQAVSLYLTWSVTPSLHHRDTLLSLNNNNKKNCSDFCLYFCPFKGLSSMFFPAPAPPRPPRGRASFKRRRGRTREREKSHRPLFFFFFFLVVVVSFSGRLVAILLEWEVAAEPSRSHFSLPVGPDPLSALLRAALPGGGEGPPRSQPPSITHCPLEPHFSRQIKKSALSRTQPLLKHSLDPPPTTPPPLTPSLHTPNGEAGSVFVFFFVRSSGFVSFRLRPLFKCCN